MRNVIKSIIFVLGFLVLLELVTYSLLPLESVRKFGKFKTSSYDILNERLDTIDVVFMGDSLIYSSISPLEIWNKYGYTSYDYATPAQLIVDTLANMEVVIESQSPKIIFMEANVLFRNPLNAPNYSKFKYQKRLNQAAPIVNYHNNWKIKLFKFVDKKTDYSSVNNFKGFRYITKVKSAKLTDYMKVTNEVKDLPFNNLDNFKKIVELCEKNNVKLILISTPNKNSWNYSKYLGTKKLAEKYSLEYIDLNLGNPLNIDWTTETKDKGSHVNYSGARKVTEFIGEYLYNSGLLIDHRSDIEYEEWNMTYKRYENVLKSY